MDNCIYGRLIEMSFPEVFISVYDKGPGLIEHETRRFR